MNAEPSLPIPAGARSLEQSYVETVEYVRSSHSFHGDTAFGGQLFSWMDSAAVISVARFACLRAITASVEVLRFLRPVKTGGIVMVRAQVTAVFRTSCHVLAQVVTRPLHGGAADRVAFGLFTMVAVDEGGQPTPLPPAHPGDALPHWEPFAQEIRQIQRGLERAIMARMGTPAL